MARILVLTKRIEPTELARLVGDPFPDMVKFVVDLRQRKIAIGGHLHADAEEVLIEEGSRQDDLWGGNYLPGRGEEQCIQYTSLINIRPGQGNRSMSVEDPDLRKRVRSLVFELVGSGEALA